MRLSYDVFVKPVRWMLLQRQRSFAFRFYTTLVPWIVLINLFVAGLAALWGVDWAKRLVVDNRTHAIQSLVFAVSKPLHDFEFDHVQFLLNDFPRNGSIEDTWITDDTGFEVARANREDDAIITGLIEVPIVHQKATATVPVGTLHVAYSDRELISIGIWTALHTLLITLATTIAAILIIVRLAQTSVMAPLKHLAGAIVNTRRDGIRYRVNHSAGGEFGTVISAFNAMQSRLDRDEQELLSANSKLRTAATADSLTGLLNRAGFEEQGGSALRQAQAARGSFILLFIDLDRFKSINDTFGHAVGDAVLKIVGQRVVSAATEGAIVARLSGDEFVVLMSDNGEAVNGGEAASSASDQAERIGRAIGKEFNVGDHRFKPVASIGYVISEADYSLASLMKKADAAMYEMKKSDTRLPTAYTPFVEARTLERLGIEQALIDALDRDYFTIVIQPIIDLTMLKPVGGEVLLRLNHPVRGVISPSDFIPVAEDCGLMPEIGFYVFTRAVQALKSLQANPATADLYISVNVSSIQISENFLARVMALVREERVDPDRIVMELTENVALKEDDERSAVVRQIQDTGMRIALDDFGTGYSSLAYIANLNPDLVKIDRTFIHDEDGHTGDGDRRTVALRNVMTTLCADLDLPMIGEGIETEQDLACCRQAGIRYGQGYLFARPLSPTGFTDWVGVQSGHDNGENADGASFAKRA